MEDAAGQLGAGFVELVLVRELEFFAEPAPSPVVERVLAGDGQGPGAAGLDPELVLLETCMKVGRDCDDRRKSLRY